MNNELLSLAALKVLHEGQQPMVRGHCMRVVEVLSVVLLGCVAVQSAGAEPPTLAAYFSIFVNASNNNATVFATKLAMALHAESSSILFVSDSITTTTNVLSACGNSTGATPLWHYNVTFVGNLPKAISSSLALQGLSDKELCDAGIVNMTYTNATVPFNKPLTLTISLANDTSPENMIADLALLLGISKASFFIDSSVNATSNGATFDLTLVGSSTIALQERILSLTIVDRIALRIVSAAPLESVTISDTFTNSPSVTPSTTMSISTVSPSHNGTTSTSLSSSNSHSESMNTSISIVSLTQSITSSVVSRHSKSLDITKTHTLPIPPESPSSSHVGLIVGLVIAAVVVLCCALFCFGPRFCKLVHRGGGGRDVDRIVRQAGEMEMRQRSAGITGRDNFDGVAVTVAPQRHGGAYSVVD